MEVLGINEFLSFKTNPTTQELDSKTLTMLNILFPISDKRKKNSKGGTNILKNHKIQHKKETITNRVNLILNKLSESNMDSLVSDFIENISQIDNEQFDEVQKAFYVKIISEINFIKIYLQFFKTITYIYNKVMNFDISYFISIVETKFKMDYTNYINEDKYSFLCDNIDENKRINNLNLLKSMIENKFFTDNIMEVCDNIILNQTKYYPDIYFWLNSKNRELTKDEVTKIKSIVSTKLLPRDKVLLESLLNKSKPIQEKVNLKDNKIIKEPRTSNLSDNTIALECNNIIEEYILMKSNDDMKYFIETRCTDAITKNKFCYQLIDKYFLGNKESSNDIIELIKQLIKSQILFKSNLSRGLLLLYNNWKDVNMDYVKPNEKMKTLLVTLKSIGITKGLETLIENYLEE
jgi:hypothetical protein